LVALIGAGQGRIGKTSSLGKVADKRQKNGKRHAIESKKHENFQDKN
jgi:hypothetical protein